jgi:hypothetical protein
LGAHRFFPGILGYSGDIVVDTFLRSPCARMLLFGERFCAIRTRVGPD